MLKEDKVTKAQEGDLKFIEEICENTWEALYRFIYYKVQNREEAEDMTQETYVKALSYFNKGNTKIDKYISYLKIVSLNVIRDRWRKRKRHGSYINLEEVNPDETSIEDSTEASVQQDLIRNALQRLNQEQRTVIELRIIKGYTAAETAKLMNKKEGNIRVLQYRALQALNQILSNID